MALPNQVTNTSKRTSRQHKQKNNTHRQRQEILIVKSSLLKTTKGLAMWPNYHTSTHLAGAAISSTCMNICILCSSQLSKSLHRQYTVCLKASFNSLKINANNSSQTEQTEAREICPLCVFHPGKESLKSLSCHLCIRHKQCRQEVLGLN